MLVTLQFLVVLPFGKRGGFQHLGYKDRMMSRERPAALRNYIRLREIVFIAHLHQRKDCIVGIILKGINNRALAGAGTRTVVVHTKTATDIDIVDSEPDFRKLHIKLHRLAKGVFDAAYLRNLTADMEMNQLQP